MVAKLCFFTGRKRKPGGKWRRVGKLFLFAFLFLFVLPSVLVAGPPYRVVELGMANAVAYPSGRVEVSWLARVEEAPSSMPNAKVWVHRISPDGRDEQVGTVEVPADVPVGTFFQMNFVDTVPVGPTGGLYTYYMVAAGGVEIPEDERAKVDTSKVTEEGDPGVPKDNAKKSISRRALFNPEEWRVIMLWYTAIATLSGAFLLFTMIRTGYRYIGSGFNPGLRVSLIEEIQRCLVAMAIIALAPVGVKILVGINNGFVGLFAEMVKSLNIQVEQSGDLDKASMFEQVLAAPFQLLIAIVKGIFGLSGIGELIFNDPALAGLVDMGKMNTGNVFADALLDISMLGFVLYFNAVYTIRHWVIVAALASTPLVMWVWLLTAERQVIEIWASEIFQTIFVQSAHALTLGVFLTVLCGASGSAAGTAKLAASLIKLAEFVASFGGVVALLALVFLGYRMAAASSEKAFVQAKEAFVKVVMGLVVIGLSTAVVGFMVSLFGGDWGTKI